MRHYSAEPLEYDYYRESCLRAEKIVRDTVRRIHDVHSGVAPALLRLVFHDCFIEVMSSIAILISQCLPNVVTASKFFVNLIVVPRYVPGREMQLLCLKNSFTMLFSIFTLLPVFGVFDDNCGVLLHVYIALFL